MSPEQYRADYGLPKDYPMVAPNYSEHRRTLANSIGLGRKKGPKPKRNGNAKRKADNGAEPQS
jgi:predicted transcriptional regulator